MRVQAFSTTLLLAAATACSDANEPAADPGPSRWPVIIEPGHIDTLIGSGRRATDQVDADADGVVDPPIRALKANLDTPMDTTVAPDGTLFVIDWNGHKLRGLNAEGMLSFVAGTSTEGDACEVPLEEGRCPSTSAQLNHPTDMVFDSGGSLWIAAWHNSKLKCVDPKYQYLRDMCGTGNRKFEGDGGPCRDDNGADLISFDLPSSIVFDAFGNIFVSDQSNQVVRRIGQDGIVKTVAGNCPGTPGFGCPNGRGYSGDGGPAVQAQLNNNVGQGTSPHGKIAIDGEGNLFIADTINNAIRKVSPGSDGVLGDGDQDEEIMTTVAGTGEAGASGDGGLATEAQLYGPTDVAVAPDGTLFIADAANACVRRVDPEGIITTVAGQCGLRGDSGDGGLAIEATLRSPYGLSLDAEGGLYIADGLNNRIRKVSLQ